MNLMPQCFCVLALHDNGWHTAVIEVGQRTVALRDTHLSESLEITPLEFSELELTVDIPGIMYSLYYNLS